MGLSRWPVRARVLVNLVDGRAFDAVLLAKRGPLLVLADARLLEPGADPTAVDGEVIVERSRVAFIQVRAGG
ncbi:MAG TPA: hypothetical protein VK453_24370 [Micromonosporaceae bacterium]|nr:hypothetical protein [Micromonosporaceae bacterium]